MFFPTETKTYQKALVLFSWIISGGILALFSHTYGVDVLMADRLDTWAIFFKDHSFWEGFSEQHGPHRVGMLYVFSAIGYALGNGFDSRFDLYVNALVIWATVPLGLWVKYKITRTFNWYDLILPFIITASWQWATLIFNPHIHVMLPLFALLFAGLMVSNQRDNLLLNCALIFAATFSVYALFAALIFVLFQGIRWLLSRRINLLLATVVFTLFSLYLFFYDFRWVTLNSAGHFDVLITLKAPILILSNFFYVPNWLGLLLIVSLILLVLFYFNGFDFKDTKKVTSLFLLSAACSFVFFQSIGRAGDDPIAFSAFRYYTELVLFIWVIAIFAGRINNSLVQSVVFVLFMWVWLQPNNPKHGDWIAYTKDLKELKACVLETEDLNKCNETKKLQVHANPEKSQVVWKWLLLEERKQAHFHAN